ncbi:protein-S-isoprenylcysteine O-methyltransferase [Bradyrhizobium sp. SYSU BS000235]|uniref:protein-S-isoprenylcysteine O-methyltransferase n=1 Tax=Bradyrhizobium sp. SYSU BS000235 TaxID=3411332 RepID=UPI003C763CCB
MTPSIAKVIFALLALGWYVIRFPYERRSRRTPVVRNARGPREIALLLVSLTGLGILPFVYIATGFPRFAGYSFRPAQAWLGLVVAIAALVMFRLTHKALGRNWSVSLEVRESHTLISDGVYRYLRHPMYTAFWLWAIAQALLLPNWFAGCAGLVGFGILFFGRVAKEEALMLESFGEDYRKYMSRTCRVIPWIY